MLWAEQAVHKPLAVDLDGELMEKCERCGGEIIGTSAYGAVNGFTLLSLNYFYLCKNCSRELDKVAKANPNEKGGVVGLCTKMNMRFACWVKTGRIMPYDEAVSLLEDHDKYGRELKRLWAMSPLKERR